jgi:hypothetical protein
VTLFVTDAVSPGQLAVADFSSASYNRIKIVAFRAL